MSRTQKVAVFGDMHWTSSVAGGLDRASRLCYAHGINFYERKLPCFGLELLSASPL